MAGKILVHLIPILSLFDSGASHCFISSNFITLHVVPLTYMDNYWDISTRNGVITTNKICKACEIELCDRKLEADLLDIGGYDVILSKILLGEYHAVIDCRNKKLIFRILHQPEF